MTSRADLILLTGASGHVGARLLAALSKDGRRLRCLVPRGDSFVPPTPTGPEIVPGDVLDSSSLQSCLRGVHTAFYLIQKPRTGSPFEDDIRRAAKLFAAAAREAGVRRIIHLRGLCASGKYSGHLCRPEEVSRLLRGSGARVADFHASVIVGSGSLAFEMVRAIAERVPVMVAPKWTRTLAQPIATGDVVAYLRAALDTDWGEDAVFEIGGAHSASFLDLIREYMRLRNLSRPIIPLPVLAPRLSILWLSLVAPLYARIGQELVATLCRSNPLPGSRASEVFPVRPRGIRAAIQAALDESKTPMDPPISPGPYPPHSAHDVTDGTRYGPRILDLRLLHVPFPRSLAFKPIAHIGGKTGWYYANWLWQLRALLDRLMGGVPINPSRRHPDRLQVGDQVDLWRVEAVEQDRLLRLVAEMKLPGRAWLEFELEDDGPGCNIRQTAIYDPVGLLGLLYWYALYPAHEVLFPGMLRGIAGAIPHCVDSKAN